jgi:glyoxylase-like metal-dependent hydrolase (beta-lactamase superfamily II)
VRRYWDVSLPVAKPGVFPPLFERLWADWADLVLPEGIDDVRCDLNDAQTITWRDWTLRVVATPGHSKDHVAYLATRVGSGQGAERLAFCGDALCSPGHVWSPYTCDGHHVNDDGLRAAGKSLKQLAALDPSALFPEHGDPILTGAGEALRITAARLERAADLKSFERYTKDELGSAPKYSYLAPEQVGTANPQGNPKPWTRLSPHLFLTGNTYALVSHEGPVLLVDAYSPNIVERVAELKRDHGAGPVEIVTISHAHNDHYTGVFALAPVARFEVWALDQVAAPIERPGRVRAPYLDARPVHAHLVLKDGETVRWHEYELKFHHLPGQTQFAMGLEAMIDSRRCIFTGDNFYHQDQYTGSGGWSGRNRGLPGGYLASAKLVEALRPDWVLAEHGGAFEFHAEDFSRRARWAKAAAAAADALSPSGQHRFDWDPHRIAIEPALESVRPGRTYRFRLEFSNPLEKRVAVDFRLPGRGVFPDQTGTLAVDAHGSARRELELTIAPSAARGRHIFPLLATRGDVDDPADVVLVLRIE